MGASSRAIVRTVTPAEALPALQASIAELKSGNPLTPVTVVVPTNATGVTARRWLGRHGGVAGVDMLTLGRVAELLAGPALAAAGRAPVSRPVIELTLEQLLRRDPGAFGPVADHPSTVDALVELYEELRLAGPTAPNRLAAASRRGRAAAEISTRLAERLAPDWYDQADLLAGAAHVVASGQLPPRLRRIVVFLPRPPRPLERELYDALAARAELITIDDALPTPPQHVSIVSTTDADEEVRHAVRTVVRAAHEGVPFARMAIVWPSDEPYARLVEHHLTVAGVPWNGRPGSAATERVVTRFLLDLLDVDRRNLRRSDVFDLLTDLELHHPSGGRLPVARWERVARRAGVAGGTDWEPKLRAHAERERARAAESGWESSATADAAEGLADYVAGLARALGPRHRPRPWREWSEWCIAQINERLGATFLARLPEAERLAWGHTTAVLDRLGRLDSISEPVTRPQFREMFLAEFEAAPGRLGRIGEGVTVGSLGVVAGPDLDLAVVLGAAEGLLPPAPTSGPLVGDADREAAGLAPSDAAAQRALRGFLAAIGGVPRVTVTYPRGDLRGATERLPSRWLDAYLPDAPRVDVPSHHAALRTAFPAHAGERRLRSALRHGPGLLAPTDPALARALRVRAARRSDDITEFDGDLSGVAIEHFTHPVPPTQIELWIACPHAYFVTYLLGVRPLDDPEAELEIRPNTRGDLVHDTLDELHREVIAGVLPQPTAGWQPEHIARALELFEAQCAAYERTGRTGRPASWAVERQMLHAELLEWFHHDSERLRARRAEIVWSEGRFGEDGDVWLPLPDGSRLAVRGRIDRVDRTASGTLVVVDHKTGKPDGYKAVLDHPTADGTLFQLPVYAAGARALVGETDAPVEAYYSFFRRGGYAEIGYALSPDVAQAITESLGTAVDGIRSGLYPARPEKPGWRMFVPCDFCEPDGLGTAERWDEWERKRRDPRGARWFAEPADENESETAEVAR